MKYLLLFIATLVSFLAIDMIWLAGIAKNFYRNKIGLLLSDNVNWIAAIVFYIIYVAGILWFAVMPAHSKTNVQTALLNGAILGFLCYATYDLTNLATLKNWSVAVTLADIVWGTFLTASVAAISYFFASKLV